MHKDIVSQLKTLQHLTPPPAVVARGRARLLQEVTPQKNPWHIFRWAGAFAFALALLFVATFSIPARPTLSASFEEGVLEGEFEELPIVIELQSLTYRAATERTLASAVDEIGGTDATHLNTDILSSEFSSLESTESISTIDTLLEEVLE